MSGKNTNFEDNKIKKSDFYKTTISFMINNKHFLKKYNQIWKSVEKLLKIEFDSKSVYGDDNKYIKTKIKVFNDSVNTNFQSKKAPKEKVPWFVNNNVRFCQSK